MLIKDVIQGMQSGALTGKRLAEQYGVSARTISKRISSLGYKYDNTGKTYTFTGSKEDLATIEALDFGSLFTPTAVTPKTVPTAKPTARKNVTTRKAVTASKAPAESPKQAVLPLDTASELDNIDKLFLQAERPERVYRGYYFDQDILAVIDKSSNKSALVNEALRVIFTAKGLL